MAHYRIEWAEGTMFRTDPKPCEFVAKNDVLAVEEAAAILDVLPPFTVEKLHREGATGVYRGEVRIFPR
ncbi:MAG: hypothetical protein V1489_02010 [Candidatus Liptonbacteria bacterium]